MKRKTLVVWLTVLSVMVSLLPINALPAAAQPIDRSPIDQTERTTPAAPTDASTWCVAGGFQPGGGWNNGSDALYDDGTHGDLVPGDGIYSLDYSIAKAAGYYEWKIFSCGTWNGYPGEEGNNKWLYTTANPETVKFVFDTNTLNDGYKPSTNMANVVDSFSALSSTWTAVGDWQGWDNGSITTTMSLIAPGLYAVTYTVPTAGSHLYKATETGSWTHQFGPDGRSTDSGNFNFTTTTADQVVGFYLDAARGRIKAVPAGAPGTASWYLRGTMNGWSGTQDQLYDDGTHGDLVSGDGVYSLNYTFASAGDYFWKITVNDWSTNYPNNNAWLTVAAGQTVRFTLDTNNHNDDWWPKSNIVNANDVLPTTWTAVGAWQGWANANPASALSTFGSGQYAVTYTVASPTNYSFKIVKTGEWEHQYGAGGRAADSQGGASEVNFQTYQANQTIGFYLDTARGRVKVVSIPPAVHAIDGVIDSAGLYHDTRNDLYRAPFGAVQVGDEVTLRFRAYHNDLTGVRLRMADSVGSTVNSYPMNLVATDGTYDYYEYTVPTNHATIYWYSFVAMDMLATVFYGDNADWWNAPWTKDGPGVATTDAAQLGVFQLTVYLPDFTTPDWLKNGTIYQIFPDRFRNYTTTNDLPSGSFFYGNDEPWGPSAAYTGTIAHATWNQQIFDPRNDPNYIGAYSNQFYGGDLKGITEKLDYLKSIGVTVLYLNPIFKSPSNHKYDTTDYTQIDPAFGTNQDFADLTQAAQARGIHVVLDGVFNHSSSDSQYFDKYSRWNAAGGPTPLGHNDLSGAYESITSTYFSWFFFNPWPAGYTAWAGYMSLPKLNSGNPLVRSFIYSGTNPIATRWIMSGSQQLASGWRFDVAGDVDPGYSNDPANNYWIGFRDAVRSVYSQTAMISEEWGNASQYLLGNQMDSTMNYRFRNALIGFVRDTGWTDTNTTLPHQTPSQFFTTMQTMQEDYPAPAWYAMMNLVGSHDTNRLRFVIKESTDVTSTVDARQKLTALAQFSLPGAPTVYYADEVGASADGVPCSTGATSTCGDPYNRLPFPWNDTPGHYQQEPGILPHYTTLGNVRQANSALRTGSMDLLLADDTNNTLAYGRQLGSNVAIAVFNRNAAAQDVVVNLSGYLAAGTVLTDVLTGNVYTPVAIGNAVPLTLTLSGNTGALLVTDEATPAPAAPTNLAATEGNAQVVLNWNGSGAGYNVYRSLVSGGGYTRIATDTLTTVFTDTTVKNGTLYYYVVTALDTGLQESAHSNEVAALPHAPIGWAGNLVPSSIVHTIGLAATPPITAEVYVDGVTNSAGQGAGILAQIGYGISGTLPATWTTWQPAAYATDNGANDVYTATLTPEMTGTLQYLMRFSTTNGNDWTHAYVTGTTPGELTVNASSDVTPPAAPVLSLANWNVDSLTLAWTEPTDPDDTVRAYDLYRYSATEPNAIVSRILSPTLVYTDYTVFSGVTYTYTVVALDTSFNPSVPSNPIAGKPEQRLVEVTFNVTVPDFTPAGSALCIPGDNAKIMGSTWTPSTLPMTQVDATHWTKVISATDGTQLQYKYTRCSSWNVVEWWGDIVSTANRHTTLNYGVDGHMVISDTIYNWRDPIVIAKSPLPGTTGLWSNTVITASWSRPLNPTSLPANFKLASASETVPGTTGFISSTTGYVSVFTPTSVLLGGTYTATLGTGIIGSDNEGAGLQQAVAWNFTVDPVSIAFVTPTNNQVFTATNGTSVNVPIQITTTNFTIPADGHWHLWVDGTMVGPVLDYTTTQTLLVGSHVITAELQSPIHVPLGPVATVNVTVNPATIAFVTPTNNQVFTATNGTSIVVPLEIATNIAIPADGHWHLWVDGTMAGMVYGYTTTQTLLAGAHVITAELVNTAHQPLGPVATANVTVNPVSIAFVAPTNNQVFMATNGTSVNVPLQITTTNFTIPTDGHWHLWVDGSMVSMVYGYTATQTLLTGAHVITAELVDTAHQPLGPVATVNVTVNPATIAFVTPTNNQVFVATNGTSVNVPIQITTTNFVIPDDGHWHLWVDGTMVGMVYGYTATQTLLTGAHVITAELVDTAHQPLGPVATVNVVVNSAGISFVTPTNGQVFTATNNVSLSIPIQITTTNFVIPTDGHWHLWVDGTMIGPVLSYTTTQTLLAGAHVITAELQSPTHVPLGPVASVTVQVKKIRPYGAYLPMILR
jgi:glycosidase